MAIELFVSKIAGVPVRIAHSHSTSCDHKILHYLLTPLFFTVLRMDLHVVMKQEIGYLTRNHILF